MKKECNLCLPAAARYLMLQCCPWQAAVKLAPCEPLVVCQGRQRKRQRITNITFPPWGGTQPAAGDPARKGNAEDISETL